ncbi:hypothetical protein [Chitinilyticum litopenaei]|uniref:hypothetical protein n=1 Tax=Chitinilyticum litopenaei TaxID=1121276 RepID=UPI00130D9451|nr:hypothetical protein [Chitinilyticum litopenaei]
MSTTCFISEELAARIHDACAPRNPWSGPSQMGAANTSQCPHADFNAVKSGNTSLSA